MSKKNKKVQAREVPAPLQPEVVVEPTEWAFKGSGYALNPFGALIHFDPAQGHVYKTKDKRVADHLRKCKVSEL